MRISIASTSFSPEVPSTVGTSPLDKVKVDPHKYLIFNYSKESEEWVSFITLWNNDLDNSYIFNIDYNKKNDKECFIIRPRKEGHLMKQTGFGRKLVLKVTYDPRNDEPSIRHSKEKLGSEKKAEEKMQTFCVGKLEPTSDTRRYFKLQIWKVQPNSRHTDLFRCQYLLPIFFHPQHTNTEVFVYPAKSITFNRNQGNQYSYWKNNFFIINNASQSVYFKILSTRLPNNCDMVVFPTSGVVQHSFSDYILQKRPASKNSQPETDQDMSGKHYTIVSILLLDPEKAYLTHAAQKPIATIVMLYSYQKHPETDNLDELLQWASGKETIEIFVRDMSHNVAAKNIVVHDKRMLEVALQNSMDQIYKLENMTYQYVARQTRNALNSPPPKPSRGAAASQSALFMSYSASRLPSNVMASGNAKELFSFSSLPDYAEEVSFDVAVNLEDDAGSDALLPTVASTPMASMPATESDTTRSRESDDDSFPGMIYSPQRLRQRRARFLDGAVGSVRRRAANERRITITYGVSDGEIRQLISQLRQRGCDASRTPEPSSRDN